MAKLPGRTSFSSLSAVKKSLETTKVGHTGTLDSFAQGLLVVCAGSLTRLADHITGFNKSYEAVIEFGKETSTLDPEGEVVATARLPSLEELKSSLEKFTGKLKQVPPAFSAIHVDGKRASDATRKGHTVEIPPRDITVYKNELLEVLLENDRVKYARVSFDVSKGTYIRALARDIGLDCSSRAYLAGLLRTKVGTFELKDAAGYNLLRKFTIADVLEENALLAQNGPGETRELLMAEIPSHVVQMTPDFAGYCGLETIHLKEDFEKDYFNGRPLRYKMFDFGRNIEGFDKENHNQILIKQASYCVFTYDNIFCGMLDGKENRFSYGFVVPFNLIEEKRKNSLCLEKEALK